MTTGYAIIKQKCALHFSDLKQTIFSLTNRNNFLELKCAQKNIGKKFKEFVNICRWAFFLCFREPFILTEVDGKRAKRWLVLNILIGTIFVKVLI